MGGLALKIDHIPTVSVIVVSRNNEVTIRKCLDSILSQQGDFDIEVILVDNASSDNTLNIAREYPSIETVVNDNNLGFCRANNIGISKSQGEYIMFLNPDARLTRDYIDTLIDILEMDLKIASITGKVLLMRSDGSPNTVNGFPIIDTLGIHIGRNRRTHDIGRGEQDRGQFDTEREIFGVCAAVCLCRTNALLEAMVDGQLFDEEFFAYKEDVDLSWRLNLLGWKCYFTHHAVAYHARGWGKKTSRKDIPRIVRFHSFKNHRLVILKNDNYQAILLDLAHILLFELASFLYVLFREPFLLKAYWHILQAIPYIRHWRSEIHSRVGHSNRGHQFQNQL